MAAVMPERARENAVASSVYRMRDKGSLASTSVPAQEDDGAAAAEMERVQTRKRKYSPIVWDIGPKREAQGVAEHGPVTAATPPQAAPNRVSVSPDADQHKMGAEVSAASVEPEAPGPTASASVSGSRWTEGLPLEKTREAESFASKEANGNGGSGRSSGGEEQYEQDSNGREVRDSGDEPCDTEEDSEDELPRTPKRYIDMLKGCRSVDEFERLNRIDEGTYGVVYRARERKTGQIVALKRVKMDTEREGFPMTSLREINVLLSFHHPSIVDVKEVVVGSNLDSIFMVMEYMEHDLKSLMEAMRQPFSQSEVKCLMLQLFQGVAYLHRNWVIHRDLKTSNLLLNNRGELKICDFGMARQYGSPLKTYTRMVVTLWYRAPELLLGSKRYDSAVDMWSLGCIMAEFLAKEPLFSGKTELDQLDKIFKTLGTPHERIWPGLAHLPGVRCNFIRQPYNRLREQFPPLAFGGRPALSESGYDLLNKLLTYDPEKRISAEEALNHEWFREVPLPKMKELMPTFPVRSQQDRRLSKLVRSPDPLDEQRKRELRQAEFGAGGVFG